MVEFSVGIQDLLFSLLLLLNQNVARFVIYLSFRCFSKEKLHDARKKELERRCLWLNFAVRLCWFVFSFSICCSFSTVELKVSLSRLVTFFIQTEEVLDEFCNLSNKKFWRSCFTQLSASALVTFCLLFILLPFFYVVVKTGEREHKGVLATTERTSQRTGITHFFDSLCFIFPVCWTSFDFKRLRSKLVIRQS